MLEKYKERKGIHPKSKAKLSSKSWSQYLQDGILEELISDSGTQSKSLQFDKFKAKYGFKHTTSNPHHPQANGAVESGVWNRKIHSLLLWPIMQPQSQQLERHHESWTWEDWYYFPPNTDQSLRAKTSKPCSSKKSWYQSQRGFKESLDKRNGSRELLKL